MMPCFFSRSSSGTDEEETDPNTPPSVGKDVKGKTHTYYQALIDGRDCPYITHRAQTESVTFLGNHTENTRNLYAIPGLDYVAHADIIPYRLEKQSNTLFLLRLLKLFNFVSRTDDRTPIQHELFDKFLAYREGAEPPFAGQSTLKAWQEKNHPWLELSDVHKETTEDIRVTVIPFYMGYRDNQANNVYWVQMKRRRFCGFTECFLSVALLHPTGESRRQGRPASGEELEDIFALRDVGDGAWSRGGGPGADPLQGAASIPILLPRQSSGSFWAHVVSETRSVILILRPFYCLYTPKMADFTLWNMLQKDIFKVEYSINHNQL